MKDIEINGTAKKNRHVIDYLAYYISLPHPPLYAVLIDGSWGIGKTYLVREFLEEYFGQEKKYVYVSLYGLATIDEIDTALFQAIYPILGRKDVKLAGRIAKTALKFFGVEADIKVGDILKKLDSCLYVFDDLERCDMHINKVLGYVNEFVEHDGCKVLLIANESEIKNRDEYGRLREKLAARHWKFSLRSKKHFDILPH